MAVGSQHKLQKYKNTRLARSQEREASSQEREPSSQQPAASSDYFVKSTNAMAGADALTVTVT